MTQRRNHRFYLWLGATAYPSTDDPTLTQVNTRKAARQAAAVMLLDRPDSQVKVWEAWEYLRPSGYWSNEWEEYSWSREDLRYEVERLSYRRYFDEGTVLMQMT